MGSSSLSLNAIPEGLPEDLTEIVTKLQSYGFKLDHYSGVIWDLTFPPGDVSGFDRVSFVDADLATGLLRVLRSEEERRQILFRYEQFDARWGKKVYGRLPSDTTIAAAAAVRLRCRSFSST